MCCVARYPEIHDAEVHIERPDGSRVIVIVNIAPLMDDRGEITGAINCFYDVTAAQAGRADVAGVRGALSGPVRVRLTKVCVIK